MLSEPNNDEVICPQCCHQFRAIPVNVQQLMLDAGFEPPFIAAPVQAQSEPCGYDETTGNCTNNPCCRAAPVQQDVNEILAKARLDALEEAAKETEGYVTNPAIPTVIRALKEKHE